MPSSSYLDALGSLAKHLQTGDALGYRPPSPSPSLSTDIVLPIQPWGIDAITSDGHSIPIPGSAILPPF